MWRRWVSLLLIFTVVGCRPIQQVKRIRFTEEGQRVEQNCEERLSREDSAKEAAQNLSNAVIGATLVTAAVIIVGAAVIHEEFRKDKDD